MGTLVCETVTARTMAELRAARDAARDADLVEVRLDGVADLDVAGALPGPPPPVIVTCRAAWEGGRFEGSEAERLDGARRRDPARRRVRRRGVAGRPAACCPRMRRTQLVLSHHDFHGVPARSGGPSAGDARRAARP